MGKETNTEASERAFRGLEFDSRFIKENPIASWCPSCKRREQINAPLLSNVYCFWCHRGPLRPVDPVAYRQRVKTLWQHVVPQQIPMFGI